MEINQKSFAMTKPGIDSSQILEILHIISSHGYIIEKLQMRIFSDQDANFLYEEHQQKSFFSEVLNYMCQSNLDNKQYVCFMQIAKLNCVDEFRALIGDTNPMQAAINTIRNKFGTTKMENAIHGSETQEDAKRELEYFFN